MTNIEEIISLLDNYIKLEEEIKVLTKTKGMSQDVLKESQVYRSYLNLQYELKRQVLDDGEIIEIYKSLKKVYDREKNISDNIHDSIEKEYNSKINDLEETVSNLKNSKDNLRNLIKDLKNFFNGEIIKEIKKEN